MWRGNWQEDYESITRVSEALHHDDGKYKSPYAALSNQGPTITDRRLFFVETMEHTVMLPAANTSNVKPRVSSQDKITYEGQLSQLEGVVHNDHLFDVYLGESIAPYRGIGPADSGPASGPPHHDHPTEPRQLRRATRHERLHSGGGGATIQRCNGAGTSQLKCSAKLTRGE